MSEIKVEVFQANRGDSLLVSCIGEKKTNILIDLGVRDTYVNCVQKRLEELQCLGGKIDLLILTHVDDDHIGGAVHFLNDNGFSETPSKIPVGDIWFNSYRHLLHKREVGIIDSKLRRQILRQIYIPDTNGESNVTAEDGTTIAGMLYKNRYPWNVAFGGQSVGAGKEPVIINNEVKITILSPTDKQISNLQEVWFEELIKMFPELTLNSDEVLDDAVLYASRYLEIKGDLDESEDVSRESIELKVGTFSEDPSVINASSITFILEFEGKRLLFLADSPPSEVLLQLKALFPEMKVGCPIHFDAVKVSHHGSKRNTSTNLMQQITSDVFIFSACGIYGHPHIESISRILFNTPSETTKKLYFNYETKTSTALRSDDWMNEYNYTCIVGKEPIRIAINKTKSKGGNQ